MKVEKPGDMRPFSTAGTFITTPNSWGGVALPKGRGSPDEFWLVEHACSLYFIPKTSLHDNRVIVLLFISIWQYFVQQLESFLIMCYVSHINFLEIWFVVKTTHTDQQVFF